MPKGKDPFWAHVEIIETNSNKNTYWRCNFCGKEGTGRVTRLKQHLGHVGTAITHCPKVGESTKAAAKRALEDYKTGRRAHATYLNDVSSNTSGQHIPKTANNPSKRRRAVEANIVGDTPTQSDGTDLDTLASVIDQPSHVTRGLQGKMETLDIKLEELKSSERRVRNWLGKVGRIKDEVRRIRQEGTVSREECFLELETQVEELTAEVDELLRSPVPSTVREQRARETFLLKKPVGKEFEESINKILNLIRRDDISRIGIHGMGGVGKTTLAKHLFKRVSDGESFRNVVWVPARKRFSIVALQNDIAEALQLPELLMENSQQGKAMVLSKYLSERRKSVLILDDVWEDFELEEVGIPLRSEGLKLVLTTRSLRICRRMFCQEVIEIKCLDADDALTLFEEHLGPESLPFDVEPIALEITAKCGGLPLAIIVTAERIRGLKQAYAWRDALRDLEDVWHKDMEKKVFPILKHSYDCLPLQSQQCLLRCAICVKASKYYAIHRTDLIELFIDEGLISGPSSMQITYRSGHLILGRLTDDCLLEDRGENFVGMHEMIWDMAFSIMSTISPAKVNSGMSLKNTMDEEHWSSDLHMVSLTEIKGVVQDNASPNCPKLSILLLQGQYELHKIPECFFMHLLQLKVLNLSNSYNVEQLPGSISDLIHLRALVLRNCSKLSCIPSLAKMRSLIKLDLSLCTALEEIPDGLENLVDLKYLDLFQTKIYGLRDGMLHQLVNIQHLGFNYVSAKGREVRVSDLKRLECLRCSFSDADELYMFAKSNTHLPSLCEIFVGVEEPVDHHNDDNDYEEEDWFQIWSEETFYLGCKFIWIHGRMRDEIHDKFYLPADVQRLFIGDLGCAWTMFDFHIRVVNQDIHVLTVEGIQDGRPICSPLVTLPQSNLKELRIVGCQKLKYLFTASASHYLPNLQVVIMERCEALEGITAPGSPLPDGAFPSLKSMRVGFCSKMRRLVEHVLVPHLGKLCEIAVEGCHSMEEIIEWDPAMPSHHVDLSSLREIRVMDCHGIRRLLPAESLPHLPQLEKIHAIHCQKMKEVIGHAHGQSSDSSSWILPSLQRLNSLRLQWLPELESICNLPLLCGFIKRITVTDCPKLKRIPLYLPPGPDGRPSPPPFLEEIHADSEEWWESLVWPGQPEARTLLQPFVCYEKTYL